jgi:hypothetical protein
MNLFVKGVKFRNKGAQLMLRAVREETLRWPVPITLVVDARVGTREERRTAGVTGLASYTHPRAPLLTPLTEWIGGVAARGFRAKLEWTAAQELHGVLDASGFSYSDQWGAPGCERTASRVRGWKKRGLPVILLPQAFGPFRTARVRAAVRDLVADCDLVYAREPRSAKYLREVGISAERLRIAPDFTCLVPGEYVPAADRVRGRVCIIPNYRMIDKTEDAVRDAYLSFLERCVRRSFAQGAEPFILIHDGQDHVLVEAVERRAGRSIEAIVEPDPVRIKGLLCETLFVVGSRYHGLISALVQGVPCVGTSWSHKYEELFREFGCESLLLPARDLAGEVVENTLDRLFDPGFRNRMAASLRTTAEAHVSRTREMWKEVRQTLDVPSESGSNPGTVVSRR